ncbi:hypothetical protein [Olleya sp. YS]|uniref:hypothetical protein n=1 Tax=Olleya sp. YS TaxID=3028318 RepID=UPI0024345366|nr:hypothetical protein [Olleya sp. YS]WGD36071.1 hypothetical protein Ollyesu_06540 [Olleya sp. YS]
MKLKWTRNDKIGVTFFISIVLSTTLIYEFEERFDEHTWKSHPNFRYKLVDDMIDKKLLIDKTQEEVIKVLGEPYETKQSEKSYFIYRLGEPPSFFESKTEYLLITFIDGEVVTVSLAE